MDDQTTPVDPTAPVVDSTSVPVVDPSVQAPVEATVDAEAPAEEVTSVIPEAEVVAPEVPVEAPSVQAEPETPVVAPEVPVAPEEEVKDTPAEEAVVHEDEAEKHIEEAKVEDALAARDLSPEEEVAASTDSRIDGSNIGLTTNDDIIANLPKNDQGQVEIDENGKILGLDDAAQPNQQPVAPATPVE